MNDAPARVLWWIHSLRSSQRCKLLGWHTRLDWVKSYLKPLLFSLLIGGAWEAGLLVTLICIVCDMISGLIILAHCIDFANCLLVFELAINIKGRALNKTIGFPPIWGFEVSQRNLSSIVSVCSMNSVQFLLEIEFALNILCWRRLVQWRLPFEFMVAWIILLAEKLAINFLGWEWAACNMLETNRCLIQGESYSIFNLWKWLRMVAVLRGVLICHFKHRRLIKP